MATSKKTPKTKQARRRLSGIWRAPAGWFSRSWLWFRSTVFRRPPKAKVEAKHRPLAVSKRALAKRKIERTEKWKRIAVSAGKITLIVSLVCAALVMFFEKRLIFPATKFPAGPWADAERELRTTTRDHWTEVELKTDDNVRLYGWWVHHRDPKATVLFFHGNAGNLAHRSEWLAWLWQQGYQALCIDYRGYGKSEGGPSEAGLYRDARRAYDWLVHEKAVKPEHLVLMGRSLGCAVAVQLASDGTRKVAALVLEAPFTSIGDMSKTVIPGIIPVRWLLATRMDNIAKVPHLRQPLLVIHGTADRTVPIRMGREVYEAAGSDPKSMYEVPDGRHNSANWIDREYRRRLNTFVARHAPKRR